jgi:glycosyltransferase involved in cell wall biosynthesis
MAEEASLTSLSVLVPVYNEQFLVRTSLERLKVLATSPHLERIQVIVVDDCSRDETPAVLAAIREQLEHDHPSKPASGLPGAPSRERVAKMTWQFLRHERNQGKGGAVRTAIELADCELSVIHDADLEYHPADLLKMVPLFVAEGADAVFGSRFLAGEFKRALFFKHELGNKLLTFLCNFASDLNLTDMETCYKMVRTDLLRSIPLVSRDFRIEPEITIKLAKRGARVYEVPIRYSGRTYQEGKKIGWRDGVKALAAIVRFRFSDKIFKPDQYGSEVSPRLARAPRYTEWVADLVRPHLGQRVLELGAGVGHLTLALIPRAEYCAADPNPLFVRELKKLEDTRPYLRAMQLDPATVQVIAPPNSFDTVVLQNVVEHVEDDAAVLRRVVEALAPGGRAIVLAPQGPRLFGTLDRVVGHARRYARQELIALGQSAGLQLRRITAINRLGSVAWWIDSRLLRRRRFSVLQIKLLNLFVPLLRRLEWLPLPGLSMVAVFEKPVAAQDLAEQLPAQRAKNGVAGDPVQPAATGSLFE